MAGTIRKRTWVTRKGEAKSAWLADYFDQTRTRHTKQFPTKKAADAWLLRARGEVRDGIHTPDADSLTIAEAAGLWLERGEREQLEHGTLLGYRRCIRMHVNPLIGRVKLARLTTPMVAAYRDDLLQTRSRSMAQRALTLLKMIIREMQRRGLAAQNVAQPVRVAGKSRERRQLVIGRDVPGKEEVQAMLAHAPARWRPWLLTAVFTGMRVSELRGLTWDNVDFERGLINVCQRADRWYALGPPKTAAGNRDVPMAPGVGKALKEWRLACPRTADGRLWLVFPNDAGRVMSPSHLELDHYRPLQVRAGVVTAGGGAKYGFHKLRHFFASWAIEQGFAPKRLQEILGHSSIRMTYDVYGHWFPDSADDQAKLAAGERAVLGRSSADARS
jgi:integrase